uniref:Uncharacterized protein n=1 Tax=Moniliophthora roreri TaxID=221103 RepID=A0A0W0FRH1_MONRR
MAPADSPQLRKGPVSDTTTERLDYGTLLTSASRSAGTPKLPTPASLTSLLAKNQHTM